MSRARPTDRPGAGPPRLDRSRRRMVPLAAAILVLVAACSGPILADPASTRPPRPTGPAPSAAPVDPQPIVFPRDDGAHDRLTEWWYYTGHLADAAGRRYGFEFVIFRAERGAFPVTWASHLAITDETGGRFYYAQRSEVGPQVDRTPSVSSGPTSFVLAITGLPRGAPPDGRTPWTMRGHEGDDRLSASLTPAEVDRRRRARRSRARPPPGGDEAAGPARQGRLDRLRAGRRLVLLLADGDGRRRLDRRRRPRTGGHRDGLVRPPVGRLHRRRRRWLGLVRAEPRRRDGPHPVARPGRRRVLPAGLRDAGRSCRADPPPRPDEFTVTPTETWRSAATGATYPAGWTVEIPGEGLRVELKPTVADQELDTRATTGVVYWEGSQKVAATRDGRPLGGRAYVELTGYGP